MPGRLTDLVYSRATTYCTCSAAGGCLTFFLSPLLSPSPWETGNYPNRGWLRSDDGTGQLPVLICATNLGNSRARPYCASSRLGLSLRKEN